MYYFSVAGTSQLHVKFCDVLQDPFPYHFDQTSSKTTPVADPRFPVGGGAEPLGGANLRRGQFSAKMYAKMKELDPVWGGAPAAPP